MSAITAKDVKALRDRTGAGILACREALSESAGDIDRAIELLRARGEAQAAKRAGTEALEGVIQSYIHAGNKIGVLVEVELTGLPARSGVAESDVEALVEQLVNVPSIHLMGLMTIAPFSQHAEDARATFTRLRRVRDHMEHMTGWALPELSMGMSNDFEIAIEEGATMVRIGRAIFGERVE